ncbi:hypothetical protein CCR75_004464 [Bremia lactucae]|uniref:Uncharacterized protein n=1 Tax=Bremia lactucae TaxID=4779 RepID=A0A976IHQ2_BRELC|nr:hypothetical protein CCR75_004464 [Bremia lactucae]
MRSELTQDKQATTSVINDLIEMCQPSKHNDPATKCFQYLKLNKMTTGLIDSPQYIVWTEFMKTARIQFNIISKLMPNSTWTTLCLAFQSIRKIL